MKRVGHEYQSGDIRVMVTKWQWWRLTFEGITTYTGNFDIGFSSKRWIKSSFKCVDS